MTFSVARLRLSFLAQAFFMVSFILVFLQIPVNVGVEKSPLVIPFIILFLFIVSYKRAFGVFDLYFVITLVFVMTLFSYLANFKLTPEHVRGIVQLSLSFSLGLAFYNLLTKCLTKNEAYGSLIFLLLFFTLFSILEILDITRGLSDSFRNSIGYEHLYTNDFRDELYAGHIRPKVFSAEPSFVTIVFMALLNVFAVAYNGTRWLLVVVALHLLVLWITASPIVFLSMASCFFIRFKSGFKFWFLIGGSMILVTVVFFLFKDVLLDITSFNAMYYRFERGLAGSDGSINERFFTPLVTFLDVFKNSPIFGAGLSGKSVVLSYSSLDFLGDGDKVLGSNVFFSALSFLGVFGFFGFALLLFFLVKRKAGISPRRPFIFLFFLSLTGGGLVTPRFWFFFFIFVGFCRLFDSTCKRMM